jgi:hypothetical protein
MTLPQIGIIRRIAFVDVVQQLSFSGHELNRIGGLYLGQQHYLTAAALIRQVRIPSSLTTSAP